MIITKNYFRFLLAAVLILSGALGVAIWNATRPPVAGGDFSLTYRGKDWKFSDAPKELNLVYFGYAKCPDVCPLTLGFAGSAFKKLTEDELNRVRFLFVSVDQEHDNPNDVADYATNFFSSFVGLSGSKKQIDTAIGLFPASYIVEENPKSYLGYSIIHTDRVFFLNKKGVVIDSIAGPRDVDSIFAKIKEHL